MQKHRPFFFLMHLQVPLSGPEVPGVPGRNGDKMQQLRLNISAFIIMYFF